LLFSQVNAGLDTSYFLEFPPRDIIGSKAQQHVVEVSSNISDSSDHTSSSNDVITSSENKEHDKKRRKLDHLIDSTGDGGSGSGVRRRGQFLVETPEFSSIDWNSIRFHIYYQL
jgi:hypothetical protein